MPPRRTSTFVGEIFDITRTQAAIHSIKSRLRDRGYPRADVAAGYTVYDTIAHRARITLDVIAGVRARIGNNRVFDEPMPEAPRRLKDVTAIRLLDVEVGDEYSEHALADAQRDLYQSDLFRHVEVRLGAYSAQGKVDSLVTIDVALSENFVRQVDTEVGWAVLDCFKSRALPVDKNFLGEARRLELDGTGLQDRPCGEHAVRRRENSCVGHESGPVQQPSELLPRQHVPIADAVSGLRCIAGHLRVQRAARRVSSLSAHHRGGWRALLTREIRHDLPLRLAYSLESGCTDAQPALLCAVFNRCDSESLALLHGTQPAARRGQRASRSIAHGQSDKPALGHDTAARPARRGR